MEDNKAFWEATMGAAFAPFNFYMSFMACAGMGFQAALPPPPDNTKRNRLLADLQHGLRDENPERCSATMSSLAAEFDDQDLVYSCLMLSTIESLELFGPELTYRIIDKIGQVAPDSRIKQKTEELLMTLFDYCDYDETARSVTFRSLSRIMNKAGISGAVMNRSKTALDYKMTHKDVRHWITPFEFLARFKDYRAEPKPVTLG